MKYFFKFGFVHLISFFSNNLSSWIAKLIRHCVCLLLFVNVFVCHVFLFFSGFSTYAFLAARDSEVKGSIALLSDAGFGNLDGSKADKNKSKSTGWTSMDRSTRATLIIYNTRIQLSRVQKIYRIQGLLITIGNTHL